MLCESPQYMFTMSSMKSGSDSVCKSNSSLNCARFSKLFFGSNA